MPITPRGVHRCCMESECPEVALSKYRSPTTNRMCVGQMKSRTGSQRPLSVDDYRQRNRQCQASLMRSVHRLPHGGVRDSVAGGRPGPACGRAQRRRDHDKGDNVKFESIDAERPVTRRGEGPEDEDRPGEISSHERQPPLPSSGPSPPFLKPEMISNLS